MSRMCFGNEDLSIFVQAAQGYPSTASSASRVGGNSRTWSERRRDAMIKDRRKETQQDP